MVFLDLDIVNGLDLCLVLAVVHSLGIGTDIGVVLVFVLGRPLGLVICLILCVVVGIVRVLGIALVFVLAAGLAHGFVLGLALGLAILCANGLVSWVLFLSLVVLLVLVMSRLIVSFSNFSLAFPSVLLSLGCFAWPSSSSSQWLLAL